MNERSIPLPAPSFLGELFWLLAHPATAVLIAVLLGLAIIWGLPVDHIFVESLIGLLGFHAFAQARFAPHDFSTLILFGIGALSIVLGFRIANPLSGELALRTDKAVEHYIRGQRGEVSYYLGGPLRIEEKDEAVVFNFSNGKYIAQSSDVSLRLGEVIELGPWNLRYTRSAKDSEQPRARFRFSPRGKTKGETQERWIRAGERISLDGQTLVTCKAISGDRGGQRAPLLGPAAELEVKWDQKIELAWHYTNSPKLANQYGRAPWIPELISISPSNTHYFKIQKKGSIYLLWVGLLCLIAAIALNIRTYRVQLNPDK